MGSIDHLRISTENGSNNYSFYMYQGTFFLINDQDDYSLYRMDITQNINVKIISEPVGAFQVSPLYQRIFYQTQDHSLYTCKFDGTGKQRILGGNGDRVLSFTVNDCYLFLVVENKNGDVFLYQVNQNLQNAKILKKANDFCVKSLAADQQYLYYLIFSNPDKVTLVQYDLKSQKSFILMDQVGISNLQLYKGYLVMQRYRSCMSAYDKDFEIIIMNPQSKQIRVLLKNTRISEINCYLDHIFYIQSKTEQIWTAPLSGGDSRLVWDKPADLVNLTNGCIFFVDCTTRKNHQILLNGHIEEEYQFPEAALESLKSNSLYGYLLNADTPIRPAMSLDIVLTALLSEYQFDREFFDCVVFLSCPHFNKKSEEISTLLQAGGFRPTAGSSPILFIDSSLFHNRKKGFVVATDGIYTTTTFFPYDYTFTCDHSGTQQLEALTYHRIRYNDVKRRLKLDCALGNTGLDDLAYLIELIYVFSYFTPGKCHYDFPFPTIEDSQNPPFYFSGKHESVVHSSSPIKDDTPTIKKTSVVQDPLFDQENISSSNSPHSETPSKDVASKTFVAEMDNLWKKEPERVIIYNLCKFLFMTLCFSICSIFAHSYSLVKAGVSLLVSLLIAALLLEGLRIKLYTPEMNQLEQDYDNQKVNTVYTPIGLRGKFFLVSLIISSILGIQLGITFCVFGM